MVIGILLVGLAACVPVSEPGQESAEAVIVIINGPTENSAAGLADALEAHMKQLDDCCAFDFHWTTPVRAQERQQDLYSHRAWGSAGRIARSLLADWALLIGLNDFERTVTEQRDQLHISVSTGVKVHILDDQGLELASFVSRTFSGSRVQAANEPLVDERLEPLALPLAREALPDLTAAAVEELNWLATTVSAD